MKKLLIVLLALALLLPCGAAFAMDTLAGGEAVEAPLTFPNGLNWDASIDDLWRVEKVDEVDAQDYLLYETDTMQEYWFATGADEAGYVGTYYVFVNDQLACHGIDYFPYDAGDFAVVEDELTAAYGEPAETSPGEVVDMFNAYKENFPPEILYSQLAWALEEGTKVFFLNINGEIYVYYVNEERLFDDADQ